MQLTDGNLKLSKQCKQISVKITIIIMTIIMMKLNKSGAPRPGVCANGTPASSTVWACLFPNVAQSRGPVSPYHCTYAFRENFTFVGGGGSRAIKM
jgi:hypothetical protein